jgi:hypothetical protein
MSCKHFFLNVALLMVACSMALCQANRGVPTTTSALDFHSGVGDSYENVVREDANASIKEIQSFFGAPFPDPIHFQMVPNRAGFDSAVAKFGVSPSQCWMVGLGTGDLIVVLSPQAWTKEACEHDPKDDEATRQLVCHELIHVYHGQFNPSRDFTGIEDLDWFIEGLAVYGSGQLTKGRLETMQAAVSAGELPSDLSKVWTGPNRYGFAGSLVRYIDQTWGRNITVRLLKVRGSAEALTLLGTNEKSLLSDWHKSLTRR